MNILEKFNLWVEKRVVPLTPAEVTGSRDNPNPSSRVDVEGDDFVARFTVWADGSYHYNVLYVDPDRRQIDFHGKFDDSDFEASEIEQFLELVESALTIGNPPIFNGVQP